MNDTREDPDGLVWISIERKDLIKLSQELLDTLNERINAQYNESPEQFQQSFSVALTTILFLATRVLSLNPDFAIQNAQLFAQQLENEIKQTVIPTASTMAH